MEPSEIHGTVVPGYEGVREAFEENLSSGLEVGAAFAVYRDGEPLVDLWGGVFANDKSSKIASDSLFTIFSATKGLAAICIAMLVDRGRLTYEEPVAKYWPEFAASGKERITVGELMSHQAGLVATRCPATIFDYYAHNPIAAELARQKPYFEPGTWGYHGLTIGVLSDELVRRIDGRTIHQFFAEEVADPLGLDIYMGLDAEQDHRHVGSCGDPAPALQTFTPPDPQAFVDSMTNPVIDWDWPNQRIFRKNGQPASGATANARSLAQIYAQLVCDPKPRLIGKETLLQATRERVCGIGRSTGSLGRYAAGFQLNIGAYGANPDSFGHPGLGGTVGFADPARRLGVGYTTNRIVVLSWFPCDPRLSRLLEALYAVESLANLS
ncbi:serine hydrolase domain-containing protein [Aquisediminimonas profunda]|uniref:serine hydrolase domain-containing protein n=1 Tax=Aquisediminimonas profunda TaxID=1550733 RepID=UPI001FE5CEDF|nr:serine hydrolase domain-containing protein [Aquisediminimonas profunda]